MASTRGLTLQPYLQDGYVDGATEGFRWRIEVVEARGLPTTIFLYKKVPTALYAAGTGGMEPPTEVAWAGEFNGVASAADLEDYPEGEPRIDRFPPFYRLDFADQAFRAKHEGMEAFRAVVRQARVLVATLDLMDKLKAAPPLTIGAPIPPAPPVPPQAS